MAMAVHSAAVGKKKLIVIFLILTLILGCVFLGVKSVEYHDKWVHHEVPGANFHPEDWPKNVDMSHASLYFGLYFGMTGLHATHMIIGAGLLIFLIIKAQQGSLHARSGIRRSRCSDCTGTLSISSGSSCSRCCI